jgi:hypothetical protein
MSSLFTGLTMISAAVVVYTSFCRLTLMSSANSNCLGRFVIWLLGSVSASAFFAPLAWGWRPDLMHAVILGAIAVHQIVSRHNWRAGIPQAYQSEKGTA